MASNEDSDQEENVLIKPSAKLGAVTRRKNELIELMKDEENIKYDELKRKVSSLENKIVNFENACEEQLNMQNVAEDAMKEFKDWYLEKMKDYQEPLNKAKLFIDENESSDESEDEEFKPPKNETADILAKLLKNQEISKLPKNEPTTFDGNILDYRTFMLSFESLIEKYCNSDNDKYYYLLKYTCGEANDLVKSCYNCKNDTAFEAAKKTLEKQYGNDYSLSQKYLDKLMQWPVIKSEDTKELNKFSSYLTTILNMMGSMSSLNQLNSWRDIKDITQKLPFDMRKQFRLIAHKQLEENGTVEFETLVKFVNKQASLLSLPLLGEIDDRKKNKLKAGVQQNREAKTFYADTKVNENEPCPCCKKLNHQLNDCKFFKQKSMDEKENLIKKWRLCFACLKSGHRSKDCTNKLTCEHCNKSHATVLHRNTKPEQPKYENKTNPNDNDMTGINMTIKTGDKVKCPAVPVIVCNTETSEITTTYAALDNCSSECYMDIDLMNKLGIKGQLAQMKVKTISGKDANIMDVQIVKNLEILSIDKTNPINIPLLYAKPNWPFTQSDSPTSTDIEKINAFKQLPFKFIPKKIGILIGMNMPEILMPSKIVQSYKKGPYASCHKIGWAINGPVKGNSTANCFRIKTENVIEINEEITKAFNCDIEDTVNESKFSYEEKDWLQYIDDNTTKLPDNHLQVSLPLKTREISNDNYKQARQRLESLRKKLCKDNELKEEYCNYMQNMMDRNFVEIAPAHENTNDSFYITHHAVRHKQKGKLRVVFDCSQKNEDGICLNDVLKKGPDLANTIVGVLLRFRLEIVGVAADIEKMYHMVKVPETDRNYFKFLWYENNDIERAPTTYRMTVHIFGATSSPAIANFALNKAVENEPEDVKHIVQNSFYVDDMLHSFKNEQDAIDGSNKVKNSLINSGFNLTSFVSNSRLVLDSLPKENLSKNLNTVDISTDNLPQEHALGIKWNVEHDTLGYKVKLPEHPNTKRGILATISSVYDPLFLACPALIRPKRLFQMCCDIKLNWDDQLPDDYARLWHQWKTDIDNLNNFHIQRCYKTSNEQENNTQLHIFADGSETAYGAVAYLRHTGRSQTTINIVMAKPRLTPINRSALKTIPRIELNAAKIAVELYLKIKLELKDEIKAAKVYFWTDSIAVLHYLRSDTGHFKTFVANRVAFIRSHTNIDSWRSVPGKLNPADILSRGVGDIAKFVHNKTWTQGPQFLKENEDTWPTTTCDVNVDDIDSDPELKKKCHTLLSINSSDDSEAFNKFMNSTSDLHKLKCRIAAMIRMKNILTKKDFTKGPITTEELESSEHEILKHVQKQCFNDVLQTVKNNQNITKQSALSKLDIFLDKDLLRVGGRLTNAPLPYDVKHPILLHGKSHHVKLMVSEYHKRLNHMGRETMLIELRQRYHIISGNALIKSIIKKCVVCRKVKQKPIEQKMANLPLSRLEGDHPPFYNCATDLFGPFFVSRSRGHAQEKRYGVLFTCLNSRAVHIEITPNLDTSSFINAFRRFVSRRGMPRTMISDNGTNLTSAEKELKDVINNWNASQLDNYFIQRNIQWKFQPPQASHFGGIWERMIRTIRNILNCLLSETSNKIKITDDLLSTLFCEIENTINSRPLTHVSTDKDDNIALTPNHILRLTSIELFPPGVFSANDTYINRKWRQAQYLSDVFWNRFKKEYLTQLQKRNKWTREQRDLQKGDLVLVSDASSPRNQWPLAIVVHPHVSDDGHVRSCEVQHLRNKYCKDWKNITFRRPISKLILIRANESNQN